MIELKAIVPKGTGKVVPNLQEIIDEQIRRAASEAKTEYEKTTRTWNKQPDFEVIIDESEAAAIVGTDDKIYEYVDKGTRPHKIPTVIRPYPLRFQVGYTAKTRPNWIGSRKGGSFPPWRSKYQVNHPGTEPRNFTRLIQKTIQGRLQGRINTAIRRAIRDIGKGK